jgi:sulfur carrier protein ThiS
MAPDDSSIVIDLPALVIDIQSDGSTSVGETSLASVGGMVGADLSALSVPVAWVDYLTAANIQHVQIANTPEGILILVNGQAIPSLAWDGEKLVATAEVLEQVGPTVALLDKVLPLVRNLGIGVTIRVPVAQGTEVLPLTVTDDAVAQEAIAAQDEFLRAVGTPPTFQLVITYADDGTWTLGDMTQAEWSTIAPIPWEQLNLPPQAIQAASAAGIDEIGLTTNADGIFISINGKTLPYITWADGRINHVLNLALEAGLLDGLMGANPNMATLVETVESLLPAVQASNVNIRVVFP